MSSPAEVRQQRGRRRNIGKLLLAVGIVALPLALIAALIDVGVFGSGVSSTLFATCGAVIAPVPQVGAAATACAEVLQQHAVFAALAGALGAAIAVVGIVVWVRNRD